MEKHLISTTASELRLNCLKLVWRPDKLVEQNIEAAKVAMNWITECPEPPAQREATATVEKRKPGRPKMSGIPAGSDD